MIFEKNKTYFGITVYKYGVKRSEIVKLLFLIIGVKYQMVLLKLWWIMKVMCVYMIGKGLGRYEITEENKINTLHNRQKPKSIIDFLQKELNFSSKEAIETCQTLYNAQPLVREVSNHAHKLPTPVTLDIQKENTWQSITIEEYTTLAHTLKSYPYSQRDHHILGVLHPLLIYTISSDAHSNSFSIDAAKTLLEKHNIPALLLPIKEDINTDENTKTQSYRIVIPDSVKNFL